MKEGQDEVSSATKVVIPAHIIGRCIGSYLDRRSMNALRISCREVMSAMDGMYRPWPNVRISEGNQLGIQSLVFSPDGRFLACRSRGGTIRVWDRHDGQQRDWPYAGTFCTGNISFSPDSKVLACDGRGKSLRLYDVSTGSCLQRFKGHQGGISSVAFSSTNKELVASGSTDSTVRLWDRATNKELATLIGHFGAVYSISISPCGEFLASGGTDQILRVWDLQKVLENNNRDFCQELRGHDMTIVEVAFSDRLLASSSLDMTVRLWSKHRSTNAPRDPKRRAGQLSFSCVYILRLESEVLRMKFSPSSKQLAVGTSDSKISVWGDLDDIDQRDEDDTWSPSSIATFSGKLFSYGPNVMALARKDGSIHLHDWQGR